MEKMMKWGLKTLCLLFCACNAYAIDVSLLFSNDTTKNLRPEGTISYEQNGNLYWNEPIQPPTVFIPAGAEKMPADKLRTGLKDYDLEYFSLYDEANKRVASCLSEYIATTKSEVITFYLMQTSDRTPTYICKYKIEKT